jgi:hypothetical protein
MNERLKIKFGKGIETVKPERKKSVASRLLKPTYADVTAKTKISFGEVIKK